MSIPYADNYGDAPSAIIFTRLSTLIGLAFILGGCLFPSETVHVITLGFTALIITQAILRLTAVLLSKSRFEIQIATDQEYPLYTVLVPLRDEAHMVADLIATLSKFDYPQARLQIIFVTEEDDPQTRLAVQTALRPPFEHVIVPRGADNAPRTKPHALNTAMAAARGEFITIYDAEDAPHPQQLRTAAHAFASHPKWGAIQAPLDYHNTHESWLAAQFGLEYAAQFHVWIPLMAHLGFPFPLGGTSNHIRRTALNSIRQNTLYWDSHNVTEDADLSFRLSAHGWDIGYITPPTHEEAVSTLRPWTRQRTRWMKGFMQSWRVHMSAPFAAKGWRGIRRQVTLQLTIGTTLLAGFLHLPCSLALLIWAAYSALSQEAAPLSPLITASLTLGYSSAILTGAVGAIRAKKPKLLWALPFMPLYWMCLCLPTYRAAYEYIKNPYYWAKTAHGIAAQ